MLRYVLPVLVLATSSPSFAAASVSGRWFTDGKDSIIEIGPCGGTVCGKVLKILKPGPGGNMSPVDSNNPVPNLRNRPIQGLTLLSGFKDAGKEWVGNIYDPRAGKTYKSTMVRLVNGNLKVKGCWGPFCKAVLFTPVK